MFKQINCCPSIPALARIALSIILISITGCSSLNTVKPVASYTDPRSVNLVFSSDYNAEQVMAIIESSLGHATMVKDKQRYNRTTDIRVPRPDALLGKEVSKECESAYSCTIKLVFHRGQITGETKVYNDSSKSLTSASSHAYKSAATTTQTILVPVKITETTDKSLKVNMFFDGIVKSKKYETLFGLSNILSGSVYDPFLSDEKIVEIYEAMAKISPTGVMI